MFGHHGGDVGVMVLHRADRAAVGVAMGPMRGPVQRMSVGHQHIRIDAGQRAQVSLRGVERRQRGEVVHVPNVLAEPGVPTVGDRHRVLQVRADRQCRRQSNRQRHGKRGIAAGPADRQLGTLDDANHGVVARNKDRPVMHQPAVGEVGQARHGVVVVITDRFSAKVSRCHHQHVGTGLVAGQPEQQNV